MANDSVEPDTFPKLLLRHAGQRGDQAAIRVKSRGIWRTTTWRGLADDVAALAGALAARGWSAAPMSLSLAATDHAYMPRCARRNG